VKILTALTTHNRLEYTKRTIESWQKTAGGNAALVVVDNASKDGTREWLAEQKWTTIQVVHNEDNLFPGAATNIGWHHGLKTFDADLLQRSDNDVEYLPGWRQQVEDTFARLPHLGQLGVLNAHEDYPEGPPYEERWGIYLANPGGNSVIRREIWDNGFRWEPGTWRPGGQDEDTKASATIGLNGWMVGRLIPTVANNISFHRFNDYPAYYRTTAGLRGLVAETSV
jgi:glycosyltransferase involved in cell wall biosynthesis